MVRIGDLRWTFQCERFRVEGKIRRAYNYNHTLMQAEDHIYSIVMLRSFSIRFRLVAGECITDADLLHIASLYKEKMLILIEVETKREVFGYTNANDMLRDVRLEEVIGFCLHYKGRAWYFVHAGLLVR
jgi:hypothetical protein